MRLSEAIRLGSMGTVQIRGHFVRVVDGTPVGACVLGAVYLATGMGNVMDQVADNVVCEAFPVLSMLTTVDGSITSPKVMTVRDVMILLNDYWGWTREQIADWVKTQEELWEKSRETQQEAVETPVEELVAT